MGNRGVGGWFVAMEIVALGLPRVRSDRSVDRVLSGLSDVSAYWSSDRVP